jgi:hypothetical protein
MLILPVRLKSEIGLVKPIQSAGSIEPHSELTKLEYHPAWYIPGSLPEIWIEEILRWGISEAELRIILIPRSARDIQPDGILAFFGPAREGPNSGDWSQEASSFSPTARCVQYKEVAARFWIPLSADFNFSIPKEDLAKRLNKELSYVWHPGIGLVAVSPEEILRFSELLLVPERFNSRWRKPESGLKYATRLTGLRALSLPGAEMVFEFGRDGIGSEPIDLSEGAPETLADGERRESGAASGFFGKSVSWLFAALRMLGGGENESAGTRQSGTPGGGRSTGGRSQSSSDPRELQLQRLLALLKKDPDQGLKYAIAFGRPGGGSFNRTDSGSSELGQNKVDFDLAKLLDRSGGDVWNVSPKLGHLLQQEYLHVATREISLGRYRRAAYIHGHLLDDLSAAARTLRAGNHLREAAVVYLNQLSDKRSALECFLEGKYWTEAMEVAESLQAFEEQGDISVARGESEQAAEYYRASIEQHLTGNRIPDAVRIARTKLQDPQRALEILMNGFNRGNELLCLPLIFTCLGEERRYEELKAWMLSVCEAPIAEEQPQIVAERLYELRQNFNEPGIRKTAKELLMKLISRRLPMSEEAQQIKLVDLLSKLASEDGLIRRDGMRYVKDLKAKAAAGKRQTRQTAAVNLEYSFDLNLKSILGSDARRVEWLGFHGHAGTLLAFGALAGQVVVHCSDWSGRLSQTQIFSPPNLPLNPRDLLVRTVPGDRQILVYALARAAVAIGKAGFEKFELHPMFSSPAEFQWGGQNAVVLASDRSISTDAVGFECLSNQSCYGQIAQIRLKNQEFNCEVVSRGRITHSPGISYSPGSVPRDWLRENPEVWESIQFPLPSSSRKGHVCFGLGGLLLNINPRGETMQFPSPILRIAVGTRGARSQVALSFAEDAVLITGSLQDGRLDRIGKGLIRPHLLFLESGKLVVASENQCEVFCVRENIPRLIASPALNDPIELLALPEADRFATISRGGHVSVYQVKG